MITEDNDTNRLTESRNIFDSIVNHKCFSKTSIIVFHNKSDLLEEKIKRVSIQDYFPRFPGNPHDLDDVQTYIQYLFDKKCRNDKKMLYHYFTTAVNTENIRSVFNAVQDTILQKNVEDLMLC